MLAHLLEQGDWDVVAVSRRKPRIHRTGRNVQFNAKAKAETISRVYKQADEMKVTLGEWMERAAEALERARRSDIER